MTDKKAVDFYNDVEKILKTGDNLVEEGGDIANIDDAAFGAGWNGDLRGASKDALYDALNEVLTAFGITDITGAELETLSDGSVADTLHTHARLSGLSDDNDWFVSPLGYGEWEQDGGAFSTSGNFLAISGVSGGWEAYGKLMGLGSSTFLEWADINEFEIEWRGRLNSPSSGDIIMGLARSSQFDQNYDEDYEKIAFVLDGSTGYAATSNGSSSTRTALAFTHSVWNVYKIWTDGTTAKFYVNGVLVATHITNLPTNSTQVFFGVGGTWSSGWAYLGGFVCRLKLS